MNITVLKAKLHKARVKQVELDYDGSCAIDSALLDVAGIYEYEQIQIYNITNGERLTTYAIRAQEHSGMISINGAAAHRAKCGDEIIICSYANVDEAELVQIRPILIYLTPENHIQQIKNQIPAHIA